MCVHETVFVGVCGVRHNGMPLSVDALQNHVNISKYDHTQKNAFNIPIRMHFSEGGVA